MPNVQRNYGGFDYSNYLKTLEIYGTINAENIEIVSLEITNEDIYE